jgi:hypothetical protein
MVATFYHDRGRRRRQLDLQPMSSLSQPLDVSSRQARQSVLIVASLHMLSVQSFAQGESLAQAQS